MNNSAFPKAHSFRSKEIYMRDGVLGGYFEQKHGQKIVRYFGSKEVDHRNMRVVFYEVETIPDDVEMIDDNICHTPYGYYVENNDKAKARAERLGFDGIE